jgi:hypothetical protein
MGKVSVSPSGWALLRAGLCLLPKAGDLVDKVVTKSFTMEDPRAGLYLLPRSQGT